MTVGEFKGTKYDEGKNRWDLLPLAQIEKVVKVITFGATKYGPENWKSLADPQGRYFAAAMRHLVAYRQGSKLDHESGLPHLAHAITNIVFLMWFDDNDN